MVAGRCPSDVGATIRARSIDRQPMMLSIPHHEVPMPFSYQAIEPLRPVRYNANREVAERVFARVDRHRLTMPYARWRDYAVGQIAAALDSTATFHATNS